MKFKVLGVDLGRSGKTSFCIIEGTDWELLCPYLKAISSISAPEVDQHVVNLHSMHNFDLICIEQNGPGGTFAEFFYRDHPSVPMITVDTSAGPLLLPLWGELELSEKELINIRAEMYWIVRLLFKEQHIKLLEEDAELFAQLSSLRWDYDKNKNERIYMLTKRKFTYSRQMSELDAEPFSRSPDKADSLALAALAYAICMLLAKQQEAGDGENNDEIVLPLVDGFFNIDAVGMEELR
jgi:hypothetical protein